MSAVAPMTRSAGSFGKLSGNENARMAILPVIGKTVKRLSTSERKVSKFGLR